MNNTVIRLDNISYSYTEDYNSNVHDLVIDHLEIKKGEMLAIMGSNGAGKSTLLEIMGLLCSPKKGDVYINQLRVEANNRSDLRRQVPVLLQSTYLFSTTIFENIALGLRFRKVPEMEIHSRVNRALSIVELTPHANKQYFELSGGEKRRVDLARVLVLETDILLLDEPTTGLDDKSRAIIEDVITELNQKKCHTIVFTTHSHDQVKTLSSNVLRLHNGYILNNEQ
ncbi:MAG: ABC transporter ATP-binding protein [Bacteriovoracaceae bacterium]|nr:ABC transporter ATP-binding protein [Bacteriovoracaceae bacterium]